MKITFEGKTIGEIRDQMEDMLRSATQQVPHPATAQAQGPGPEEVIPEVISSSTIMGGITQKSETSPTVTTKQRTAKQLENDERLRERAKAKKAAGMKPFEKAPKAAPAPAPELKPVPPPATAESLGLAPDEVVKVRQKTIEDLQSAYANGFQKEVFELLSRFGNGAKSFRELPPESFVPIREAIDNGALT